MTPREKQIYEVLTDEFMCDSQIAKIAGITGWYARETAAKYCISLTKKGFAERRGPRMLPKWRRAAAPAPPPDAPTAPTREGER